MPQFRSSRDPATLYTATKDECDCPSFKHRGNCGHVEQIRRFDRWGVALPDGVLPPPPPVGSWKLGKVDDAGTDS